MLYRVRKKIQRHFKINIFICILMFTVFTAGVSAGSSNFVLTEENSDVILSYFKNKGDFEAVVTDSFFKNIRIIFIIFISGMSVAGIPVILYTLFSRGVSLGAGVCALISVSESSYVGIILNLLPQIVFLILAVMIISYYGFTFSCFLCTRVFFGKSRYPKRDVSVITFAIVFLISALCCFLSALCEGWFIPV